MNSQTLPPPQGPEYTPCGCGHIEPEHEPNAGECYSCDCATYRPASAAPLPPADQPALRDRIAEVLRTTRRIGYEGKANHGTHRYDARCALCAGDVDALTEALAAAVLPATTDRRAVLREEADRIDATRADFPIAVQNGITWATAELRRHAAECPECGTTGTCNGGPCPLRLVADETAAAETQAAVDLPALAAALDGFGTLLATSSRDWGVYRVDAWLYAVILGWDCEETEHDATCTHGALEEMAQQHGWDDATVAKARRYRAAVRTLIETHRPAAGARQDGEQA